jgi:hypothetical protein
MSVLVPIVKPISNIPAKLLIIGYAAVLAVSWKIKLSAVGGGRHGVATL